MNELMAWLQDSALGHAMREHGVWTYGVVNLAHILGVSSLFGAVLVLDLRLLGAWRNIPLRSIATPTTKIAGLAFFLAAPTGFCLLATEATKYVGNPFLYIKLPAIGFALLNIVLLTSSPAWKASKTRELSGSERSRLALAGGLSLLCWL